LGSNLLIAVSFHGLMVLRLLCSGSGASPAAAEIRTRSRTYPSSRSSVKDISGSARVALVLLDGLQLQGHSNSLFFDMFSGNSIAHL